MKTTIEIPDALASEAREVARHEGSTLRDPVVTGLRAEIDRLRSEVVVDLVFPKFSGHGLLVDLSPTAAIARSSGLPE